VKKALRTKPALSVKELALFILFSVQGGLISAR